MQPGVRRQGRGFLMLMGRRGPRRLAPRAIFDLTGFRVSHADRDGYLDSQRAFATGAAHASPNVSVLHTKPLAARASHRDSHHVAPLRPFSQHRRVMRRISRPVERIFPKFLKRRPYSAGREEVRRSVNMWRTTPACDLPRSHGAWSPS